MKGRITLALATSLLVTALLTSPAGITLAGVDDKHQPATSNQQPRPPGPKAPGNQGAPVIPAVQAGTGFTYQGSLQDGGEPASGQYDLRFTLYDELTGGNQVGNPVTLPNETVTDGLFAVSLDFGPSSFQGSSRWLEIEVRPEGDGNFTTLSPRQALTATPYAMSLVPGAVITGSLGGPLLTVSNTNTTNSGITGMTAAGAGSIAGVVGVSTGPNGNGVIGVADNGTNAWGVWGGSADGIGVVGQSTSRYGVYGYSTGPAAGFFYSPSGNGVYAGSNSAHGIVGISTYTGTFGIQGTNTLGYGVVGDGVTGVSGTGTTGNGVQGTSNSGIGVKGEATTGDGLQGYSSAGTGVAGIGGGGQRRSIRYQQRWQWRPGLHNR